MNTLQPLPAGLGRFRIERELGRGGMGVVYRAFDPVVERPVAIKTISCLDGSGGRSLERLRREAKAVGSLEHPNIVALFDAGDSEGVFYLVMQFVEGETLRERLDRQRTFSSREILDILRQLLTALEYAHARGIVHRDVKPANVLITPEGTVKLTDFGVARVSGPAISTTGLVVGTPSYMSPEQMLGATLDGRSDIFAVGCILYELAFGRKPFGATTTTGVMYQVLHQVPVIPFPAVTELPSGLHAVIMKALEKEPADRYQSCAELLSALQACLAADATGSAEPKQNAGATGIAGVSRAARVKVSLRNSAWIVVLLIGALVLTALVVAPWFHTPEKLVLSQPKPPSAPIPDPPHVAVPRISRVWVPAPPVAARAVMTGATEPPVRVTVKSDLTSPRPKLEEARVVAGTSTPETAPAAVGPEVANFSAWLVKGDLAFQNDRYDEALRFYRKAELLNPSDGAIRRRLSRTLMIVGQPESGRKYSR